MLCGDFYKQQFPPQALVDALSWGTLPLVPSEMYTMLPKLYFHLSDAIQGVRKMRLPSIEAYLSDVAGNPKKEQVMAYRQTFMLVSD
jgi:hypothetical protein